MPAIRFRKRFADSQDRPGLEGESPGRAPEIRLPEEPVLIKQQGPVILCAGTLRRELRVPLIGLNRGQPLEKRKRRS